MADNHPAPYPRGADPPFQDLDTMERVGFAQDNDDNHTYPEVPFSDSNRLQELNHHRHVRHPMRKKKFRNDGAPEPYVVRRPEAWYAQARGIEPEAPCQNCATFGRGPFTQCIVVGIEDAEGNVLKDMCANCWYSVDKQMSDCSLRGTVARLDRSNGQRVNRPIDQEERGRRNARQLEQDGGDQDGSDGPNQAGDELDDLNTQIHAVDVLCADLGGFFALPADRAEQPPRPSRAQRAEALRILGANILVPGEGPAANVAAFAAAFPSGSVDVVVPPGEITNMECGLYALRNSLFHQHPQITLPSIDELRVIATSDAVLAPLKVEDENPDLSDEEREAAFAELYTNNFSADHLASIAQAVGAANNGGPVHVATGIHFGPGGGAPWHIGQPEDLADPYITVWVRNPGRTWRGIRAPDRRSGGSGASGGSAGSDSGSSSGGGGGKRGRGKKAPKAKAKAKATTASKRRGRSRGSKSASSAPKATKIGRVAKRR